MWLVSCSFLLGRKLLSLSSSTKSCSYPGLIWPRGLLGHKSLPTLSIVSTHYRHILMGVFSWHNFLQILTLSPEGNQHTPLMSSHYHTPFKIVTVSVCILFSWSKGRISFGLSAPQLFVFPPVSHLFWILWLCTT